MIDWDYTDLAHAYLKRPGYAGSVIDDLLGRASLKAGALCCDIGAGVGHLTLMLADRGLVVTAVEPPSRPHPLSMLDACNRRTRP